MEENFISEPKAKHSIVTTLPSEHLFLVIRQSEINENERVNHFSS